MEPQSWEQLGDAELLEHKISALGLTLAGTDIEPLIQQLYAELAAKELPLQPPCFVGDEWFCPMGIPAIAIPFFLTHPRLRALERTMMLEVEGEQPADFLQLIRHEAGHAYMYAYQLHRKRKWREQFGRSSPAETPSTYRPRPYSRSFVVHLGDWYAQAHPDEDFAETFAVWLTPGLDWRQRYRGWKSLQKLEYVDHLLRSLAGRPRPVTPRFRPREYSFLNLKLKTYYARKQKQYEQDRPDFFDRDLKALFAGGGEATARQKASRYLRQHRRPIMAAVCHWTNEKKYILDRLLRDLITRCDELDLYARTDDPGLPLQIAAYVTALVMNYLFTGKFKRGK
ncbi:hypothetical protein HQ590_06885 [bacterium]|nr:hypothetical protein [bacterium]